MKNNSLSAESLDVLLARSPFVLTWHISSDNMMMMMMVCVCVWCVKWSEVLKHISLCLEENNVKHVFCQSFLQTSLSMFKTSSDVNVVLLPFKLGSKGLNIVEATHVLLVEPQLNLATEVQAIGRVHRIGQTRWGE